MQSNTKENTDTESSGGKISISEETDYDTPITLKDIEILRSIGRKNINQFTSEDIEKCAKWAHKFYKEWGVKSPFFRAWFGDWRAYDDKSTVKIVSHKPDSKLKSGKTICKDLNRIVSWSSGVRGETVTHAVKEKISILAVNDISEIVENAVLLNTEVSEKKSKSKMPNTAFMHNLYSLYEVNGKIYLIKLYVEEALSNDETVVFSRAYHLKDIEKVAELPVEGKEKVTELPRGVHLVHNEGLTDDNSVTTYNIAQLFDFVNTYDKEFKPKPVNETMIENGFPKKFYHQTGKDFTVFNTNSERAGKNDSETPTGMFFKPNDNDIGVEGSKQMAVYLNARNILEFKNRDEARSYWMKNVDGYSELQKQYDEIDKRYEKIYEEEEAKSDEWYEQHY